MIRNRLCLICIILLTINDAFAQQSIITPFDRAFDVFWNANGEKPTKDAVDDILSLHPAFEDVYAKLEQGRPYDDHVTKGFMEWYSSSEANIQLYSLIFIPRNYTPQKKYAVRVFLHGAVTNMDSHFVNTMIDRNDPQYDTVQQIIVYPSGYFFAPWWSERQYHHISETLSKLKTLYNIDENNIKLGGVSDGGTGTYYFANCDATPWSCFTPYIGNAGSLDILSKRQTYLGNFSCKPFFIVNTGRDQIFNPDAVLPYVHEIIKINPASAFVFVDTSGHSMNWMNVLRYTISEFTRNQPRNPYPDSLSWETERTDLFNRNHWVIIDKLGKTKYDAVIDDPNTIMMDGASKRAFHRDTLAGTIKVIRTENEIHVKTKNVKEFTLLISPDQFDFSKPLKVITDDIISFDGILERNNEVLLYWFAKDADRTMLFANELKIEVGKKGK